MKPVYAFPILSLIIAAPAPAQQYHEPSGVLKILNDSRISYEIGTLETAEMETVSYPPQVDHGLFLKRKGDGSLTIRTYDEEYRNRGDYGGNFTAAEKAYAENRFAQARELYFNVLAAAPANSQVMTYVGQTYAHEGNDSLAELWYRKAIAANYCDYMAHWSLASLCEDAGRNDEAVEEILAASILNRNNTMVEEAMENILRRSGRSYANWAFNPRYEIRDLGNNRASIKYAPGHPEWLPYALCKALWRIEPGYRDSMLKGTTEHPLVVEEKECLVNVLLGLHNSSGKPEDPALQVARKALDRKMFNEFLVYDVILPANPRFAFILPKGFVDSVSKYVMNLRSQ